MEAFHCFSFVTVKKVSVDKEELQTEWRPGVVVHDGTASTPGSKGMKVQGLS